MPPKTKTKGKGKTKLSKAERDKLKKEEAERKALEEEEARILAEQEKKDREERDEIEREQRRLLEEQELERHQTEVDKLNAQLKANKEHLTNLQQKQLENKKWDRYMLCDGRPDPTIKKDINTFINLIKEDQIELRLEKVLTKCELMLELIDELENNLQVYRMELSDIEKEESENDKKEINEEEICDLVNSYQESQEDLRKLLLLKLDESSWDLLKSPGESIDFSDTMNILHVEESANIKVCLWGNAAKNPRVKQVEFSKDGFTMELPKQMALSCIATRVIYAKFDFISKNCSTFAYKPKEMVPPIATPQITVDVGETNGEERNVEENKVADISGLMTTPISFKKKLNVKESKGKNSKGSGKGSNKGSGNASDKQGSGKKSGSGNRTRIKNSARKGGSARTPASATSQALQPDPSKTPVVSQVNVMPVMEVDDNDFLDEDIINLRSFSTMGSIIFIELLQLPPQAKEVNGWRMQVTSGGLQRVQYGDNSKQADFSGSRTSMRSTHAIERESSTLGGNLPIGFSVSVDKNVLIYKVPQIARWDEETLHWRTNEISDVRYEEADRIMFFRTSHFGRFAIMQDIYLNMPFQSWRLGPLGLNECVFTIVGAVTEVDIIVKEDLCSVKFQKEIPEVEHLTGQWVHPEHLIRMLRNAGINMFPYEDGHKYVSVGQKDRVLVNQVYEQMALLASSFSYTWSRWNSDCGEDKIIVQATECHPPKIPVPEEYQVYMASTRVSCKLDLNENSEEFCGDVLLESQMHPDLYHMLCDGASETALKLVQDSSVGFIDCVYRLLTASDIFIYS